MTRSPFSEPPPPLPLWKRSIDIAGSLAVLPILGVFTLFFVVLLGLTSRGPVFFRQKRVGYKGRIFELYKFRTMRVGAETQSHEAHVTALLRNNRPMQKLDARRDSRMVPGAWLFRASGLDELPQILNVLRGDMSLVGPRPCMPYEYKHYTPVEQRRCHAAPGLTGLWQVSGKNRTTFETMVALDTRYCETKSLALDLRIIALTIPALLQQMVDTAGQRLAASRELDPGSVRTPVDSSPPAPVHAFRTAPGRPLPR